MRVKTATCEAVEAKLVELQKKREEEIEREKDREKAREKERKREKREREEVERECLKLKNYANMRGSNNDIHSGMYPTSAPATTIPGVCCSVHLALMALANTFTLISLPSSLDNTPIAQAHAYISDFFRKKRGYTATSGFPGNIQFSQFPTFPFPSSCVNTGSTLTPCCPACIPVLSALHTLISGLVGAITERDDALAQWVHYAGDMNAQQQVR